VQTAAWLLQKSQRSLFVAGLGAHRSGARDALIELADHVGAALATTMKAKEMFRSHPFDCGVVGSFSHAGDRRFIEQADCVVAFGAGLNLRTTSYGTSLPQNAPLIQVDAVRTNIGRWHHADVAMVADVKLSRIN
jgi:acetolactate synthase-1/2/3 large subunit